MIQRFYVKSQQPPSLGQMAAKRTAGTRFGVCVIFVATICAPANATLVSFGFQGVIEELAGDLSVLDGSIAIGTPFSGYYTFDPSVPDVHSDPFYGEYVGAISAMQVAVGSYVLDGPVPGEYNRIGVEVPPLGSSYSVVAQAPLVDWEVITLVELADYDGTAITTTAVPLEPPDLDPFEERIFAAVDQFAQFGFGGTLTDLWLVPEPGSACLLLLGAGIVAARRRK